MKAKEENKDKKQEIWKISIKTTSPKFPFHNNPELLKEVAEMEKRWKQQKKE